MLNKIRASIEKYKMLKDGDKVGVAVSGGPDSTAILSILKKIRKDYRLTLVVIHLNHGLRGDESDRDEIFVKNISAKMGLPVEVKRVNIPEIKHHGSGSLEALCREERYKFFMEVFQKRDLNRIALGHNLDDQAETVIMRVLRGSGLEGLRAMLPVRDEIYIRPLLKVSRKEIYSFLKKEELKFVNDSSNAYDIFLRNKIRNKLMPELKSNYNPNLAATLSHTAEIIQLEDDFISCSAKKLLSQWDVYQKNGEIRINLSEFRKVHEALQQRMVKVILDSFCYFKKVISYSHVRAVIELIKGGKPSGVLDLPFNVRVKREYENLIFFKEERIIPDVSKRHIDRMQNDNQSFNDDKFSYSVNIPGRVDIQEIGKSVSFELVDRKKVIFDSDNTIFMDYECIDFPLVVRNMRYGDRIIPLGMSGTKKVKRYFIDKKIPRSMRRDIPFLVDQKSVLWIMGVRMSDKVKINSATEKIVRAEFI